MATSSCGLPVMIVTQVNDIVHSFNMEEKTYMLGNI